VERGDQESKGFKLARADLHHAFAIDRDVYEASRVDRAVLDPIVRIEGGVPGTARPFLIVREYQGPQGAYVERFELRNARGDVVVRSSPARITLQGEAFEDRFLSELRGVVISDLDEHGITFFVGEDEVGSVPVFVEPTGGGSARTAVEATFAAALKKSTIIWVTVPERRNGRKATPAHTQPVWFVTEGDKVYLLHGPGEQHVPGLGQTDTVRINARGKDTRSLVADVLCEVAQIPTDDDRWEKITQKALLRRLNLSDFGDDTITRWQEHCQLLELTPRFGTDLVAPTAATPAGAQAPQQAPVQAAVATAPREDEIHVEAQVDQEVMDRLVAEGMPERVARAKAKAHYVRTERDRIRAEQAAS
jgi:hypothetical protein